MIELDEEGGSEKVMKEEEQQAEIEEMEEQEKAEKYQECENEVDAVPPISSRGSAPFMD